MTEPLAHLFSTMLIYDDLSPRDKDSLALIMIIT